MLNFVINCLKMEMEALLPMMSKSLENECEIALNNEQTVVVCIVFWIVLAKIFEDIISFLYLYFYSLPPAAKKVGGVIKFVLFLYLGWDKIAHRISASCVV